MSWTPEVRCVLHRQGARKLNEGSAGKANPRRAARQLMAMTPGGSVPRNRPEDVDLPPGQHWVSEFPALPAGPPPAVTKADWAFTLAMEDGRTRRWDWAAFRALPSQRINVDLHCVTGWSVLASRWEATSVHHMLCEAGTSTQYVVVHSYAGQTTNLPLDDLVEMPAWLAFSRDGHELTASEGGPVWLLVPHLYLWKSLPWVSGLTLTVNDEPGSRERSGYHNYGDPWRQQRFQGD